MSVEVGRWALVANRERLARGGEAIVADQQEIACLLLFYAAECGLKATLMDRGGHRASSNLERTHDLRELAKELRLPRSITEGLSECRTKHDRNLRIPVKELHEAWRYGARLDASDEKAALSALRALISWCEQT
jgi:HEPN domain-containing protein